MQIFLYFCAMLIDQLQKEIFFANERLGPEADTVIMHPDTFNEIFESMQPLMGAGPSQVLVQGITLRGCRVYRSEDVPKNQFIVR